MSILVSSQEWFSSVYSSHQHELLMVDYIKAVTSYLINIFIKILEGGASHCWFITQSVASPVGSSSSVTVCCADGFFFCSKRLWFLKSRQRRNGRRLERPDAELRHLEKASRSGALSHRLENADNDLELGRWQSWMMKNIGLLAVTVIEMYMGLLLGPPLVVYHNLAASLSWRCWVFVDSSGLLSGEQPTLSINNH